MRLLVPDALAALVVSGTSRPSGGSTPCLLESAVFEALRSRAESQALGLQDGSGPPVLAVGPEGSLYMEPNTV